MASNSGTMLGIVHGVDLDVDVIQASRSLALQSVAAGLATMTSGYGLTTGVSGFLLRGENCPWRQL